MTNGTINPTDLTRRFMLDVTADGVLFIRDTQVGEPRHKDALPIFSCDTYETARDLQILHCRRQYNGTYRLTHPITYDDLGNVSQMLYASVQRLLAAKADARG